MNQIQITSNNNRFVQLRFALLFASVSSSTDVCLNTSVRHSYGRNETYDGRLCYLVFWIKKFVAGLAGLVRVHLPQSRSFLCMCTWCTIAVLLVGAISEKWHFTKLCTVQQHIWGVLGNAECNSKRIKKSVNIWWRRYGEEFGVLFFLWLTV